TGALPWKASTPLEWAQQHFSAAPRPFEKYSGVEVSETQKAAVMRALSKDRESRQSSMREFLKEFEEPERQDGLHTSMKSFPDFRRILAALAIFGGLVVLAIVLKAGLSHDRKPSASFLDGGVARIGAQPAEEGWFSSVHHVRDSSDAQF